ncbi:Uroporphyrinogen-III C-methyltransferase [compost metagenome]
MKKLEEIAGIYRQAGLGSMPAAIIQHASLPRQKKVVCKAEDLFEAAAEAELTHPAIIIIGNVIKIKNEL